MALCLRGMGVRRRWEVFSKVGVVTAFVLVAGIGKEDVREEVV